MAKKLSAKALDEKGLKRKLIKQKIEKLTKELDVVNNDIKEMLGDVEEFSTKLFKFSFKEKVSKVLDKDLLAELHPEIVDECSKEQVTRPLFIR